jgi:hypothetical protein
MSGCLHCEEPFYAKDPRQLYCGATCRVTACRIRRKELDKEKIAERNAWQAKHWLPDPLPEPPPWRFHEVPVAIVAHPERLDRLDELSLMTNAEAAVVDDRNYGCEVNHLRAWEWLAAGNCPWSVVIEDDAVPVDRFRYQLHAALRVSPTPIVSLYLGRTRPPHWQAAVAQAVGRTRLQDACFLTASALLHGVGYAIRTSLLRNFLAELPEIVRDHPIDEAVTVWARRHGHAIGYTWPSLIDHRDEPSLIDHRDGQARRTGRVAWCADWRERWEPTRIGIADPETFRQKGVG